MSHTPSMLRTESQSRLEERFAALEAENEALRRRLSHAMQLQDMLGERLTRVENSMVFRTLRWIGSKSISLGNRIRPANRLKTHDAQYKSWTEYERSLEPSLEECWAESATWHVRPLITVIVPAEPGALEGFQLTLRSVAAQAYQHIELIIAAESLPAGLQNAASELSVYAETRGTIKEALAVTTGEYVVFCAPGTVLAPQSLHAWVKELQAEPADVVYGDWDHLNGRGERVQPRFTPDWSPELLRTTCYPGLCFLADRTMLRSWSGEQNWQTELWQTVKGLPAGATVKHVPRVLHHVSPGGSALPAAPPEKLGGAAAGASVIICSCKPHLLKRCLQELTPTLSAADEVIVVAHRRGSEDLVAAVAESHGAHVVPYVGPFHFSRMNQLGAKAAQRDVLVFLNDDVTPKKPEWLRVMVAQAARPGIGAVGALLRYPSGAIQHAGVVVGSRRFPGHAGRGADDCPYWPWIGMTREVSAVTGACLAISRAVWEELGGFDPDFPVNYNDVDLCLRARSSGYRVLLEARAELIHDESKTRSPGVRCQESELFFERRAAEQAQPDPYLNPNLMLIDEQVRLGEPWLGQNFRTGMSE